MKVFGGDHMVFRGGRREGGFNRCEKSLDGGLKRIHHQSGGEGEGGGVLLWHNGTLWEILDTFAREQNMR